MSGRDVTEELLDRLTPALPSGLDDWADVLERAGKGAPTRRRGLLLALAAVVLALVAIAATFGHRAIQGTLEDFSSWAVGEPGGPASPAAQQGFEQRNRDSLAQFPSSTKLRLLLQRRLAGRVFQLFGFRDRGSLCLRLIRADHPTKPGSFNCVPLRELPSPAGVVGYARFLVGSPAVEVSGVYGLADDRVRGVEVVSERSGRRRALLGSNAFLYLRTRPTGTVAHPPPADPILEVYARGSDGGQIALPFVSQYGLYSRSLRYRPTYIASGSFPDSEALPGPARAIARPPRFSIGWIDRREPRGRPLAPPRLRASRHGLGRFQFGRAIQPDPANSLRVGVFLNQVDEPQKTSLCLQELRPLAHQVGFSCFPFRDGFRRRAFVLSGLPGGSYFQTTAITGIASDAAASLTLYSRAGTSERVPLRDNVFALQLAATDLPGKLVAYDRAGRPIDVQVLPGPDRLRPCPAANLPSRPAKPPTRLEHLNLGTRTLGGAKILGKTPAEVRALLGRPSRDQNPAHPWRVFHYGPLRVHQGPVRILFRPRRRGLIAVSLTIEDPDIVESRIGRILRMSPLAAQQAVERAYPQSYRLAQPYGSKQWGGCSVAFDVVDTNRHLTIGMFDPVWRPYLTFWRP